jgi:hypothetical protein
LPSRSSRRDARLRQFRSGVAALPAAASEGWWALVDDLRTLPLGQIVAGIPHTGQLSLP